MMDLVFRALADANRRRILKEVAKDGPRRREEFIPDEVDDEALKRRIVNLEHKHFPYLDNAGFINWNREAKTVKRGPNFQKLHPFLGLLMNDKESIRQALRN